MTKFYTSSEAEQLNRQAFDLTAFPLVLGYNQLAHLHPNHPFFTRLGESCSVKDHFKQDMCFFETSKHLDPKGFPLFTEGPPTAVSFSYLALLAHTTDAVFACVRANTSEHTWLTILTQPALALTLIEQKRYRLANDLLQEAESLLIAQAQANPHHAANHSKSLKKSLQEQYWAALHQVRIQWLRHLIPFAHLFDNETHQRLLSMRFNSATAQKIQRDHLHSSLLAEHSSQRMFQSTTQLQASIVFMKELRLDVERFLIHLIQEQITQNPQLILDYLTTLNRAEQSTLLVAAFPDTFSLQHTYIQWVTNRILQLDFSASRSRDFEEQEQALMAFIRFFESHYPLKDEPVQCQNLADALYRLSPSKQIPILNCLNQSLSTFPSTRQALITSLAGFTNRQGDEKSVALERNVLSVFSASHLEPKRARTKTL
jgi:hypothetical protein